MDAMQMQELCRRYRVDSLEGLVDALIRENKTLREDIRDIEREARAGIRDAVAESRYQDQMEREHGYGTDYRGTY